MVLSRGQARAQERLRRLASAGLDVEAFWRAATAEVASAINFDWRPCWFTLDPTSLVITSHFNEEIDERRRRLPQRVRRGRLQQDG